MRRLAVWFLVFVGACCQFPSKASSNSITMMDYLDLDDGMSLEQVRQRLHGSGVEMSRSKIGGHESKYYKWTCKTGFCTVTASFTDNKLVTKSQVGLK